MQGHSSALLVLVAAVAAARAAFLAEKPAFLSTCYIKDPKFEDCTLKQLQAIVARLLEGFPEIGSPPLDPLHVPKIVVLSDGDGPVAVNSTLTDMRISGLSKATVIENRLDPKTFSLSNRIHVPHLRIDAKYKLSGRLLVLPINGNGDLVAEPENLEVRVHHKLSLTQREGHRFLHVDTSNVTISIGGLKINFSNLYNGQKALEESTNKYLNENWQLAFESLQPVLEETAQDLLPRILGRLLDKVPVEYFIGDI